MPRVEISAKPVDIVTVHVYMPTMTHEEKEADTMYDLTENALERNKITHCTVVIRDWNAMVGESADTKNIGKYSRKKSKPTTEHGGMVTQW